MTIQSPSHLALESIQFSHSDDDAVLKGCPDAALVEQLTEIRDLFKKCFDEQELHIIPEKWEEHKTKIKFSFSLIECGVKPILKEVPSLTDLAMAARPHSPKMGRRNSADKIQFHGNHKEEKVEPFPLELSGKSEIAELLGYYRAAFMQIEDLEPPKPINLSDLLGELLRILGIEDIQERLFEFVKFFEAKFNTVCVADDGNCCPRALVRGLKDLKHPTYGQWEDVDGEDIEKKIAFKLRTDFISFLRDHKEEYFPLFTTLPRADSNQPGDIPKEEFDYPYAKFCTEFPRKENESPEEHDLRFQKHRYDLILEQLAEEGCFFSDQMMFYVAKMLGDCKIHIYSPTSRETLVVENNKISPNEDWIYGDGPNSLHILHLGEHYWQMQPKPEGI